MWARMMRLCGGFPSLVRIRGEGEDGTSSSGVGVWMRRRRLFCRMCNCSSYFYAQRYHALLPLVKISDGRSSDGRRCGCAGLETYRVFGLSFLS